MTTQAYLYKQDDVLLVPAVPAEDIGACRRCGGAMHPGLAIENTLTGLPDFPGEHHVVTLSPGGPGRLIECLKCSACGWSVSWTRPPVVIPQQSIDAVDEQLTWDVIGMERTLLQSESRAGRSAEQER